MLLKQVVISILICTLYDAVECARILGIFPMAAPSHYILGNALLKGLAESGHDVTMISPFEEKHPPKKGTYRDIVLTGFIEEHNRILNAMNPLDSEKNSLSIFTMMSVFSKQNRMFYENENVQKLLKSDEKFDVVIVEQFLNDGMKIFGHIYNVPVILLSTVGATPWVNHITGNPAPLSYIPNMQTGYSSQMSFSQRLVNTFFYVFSIVLERLLYFPDQNKMLKDYFSDPPDIYDLYYNVSLVLVNSHESLSQAVPFVPNMIPIGGFHVAPPKKLPKDLQEYLDNAKEGVIYFSMGSNLKSKNLPPLRRDAFLTAFGKLKENVLWKWEEDNLPGKPSNVKLAKWLPQQDILAHPNVKLFITHGGLLSTTEAVYHGVPVLAIPVFGDQPTNARLAVLNGYGLALPYDDPSFSEEKLSGLLNELLTNTSYTNNIKRRSALFHDRPLKPLDTAIYWVEYVIRHGGAPHLRVAGLDLPWYIYHSIDVISFLFIITLLVIYLIYVVCRKIITRRKIRSKGKTD